MDEGRPSKAVAEIHDDLDRLKRRRIIALVAYLGVVGVVMAVLIFSPAKATALKRNALWAVGLCLLFASSAIGAAITIGFPLVRRRAVYVLGGLSVFGMLGAMCSIMHFGLPDGPILAFGLPCFLHGTALSIGAMIVLGVLSGRLWRRFPDPGMVLAIAVSSVGIAALHIGCGKSDPVHLLGFHLTPLLIIYIIARAATRARERLIAD